ncbi:RIP metalloprotease RseP [Candidatus Falkowbacteria bacterium HGW-Falkowbacteria-2]|uniref:Zinc metalloprotease n=1 Tax=Candidatus Falkowbacteria bacterium HGW-Falkowbacteria-2 TaxID=2013769 RepID=A0A2N2DZH8_9BACT|nr:MAG: RIP metalloprotease RseP [Candidatus Falkowbacteria bacterium HGW-Falkowbacteria-2]
MITALIFIAVLSVLVFGHELGHFWTARRLGVKAEEFGFGFPPRAIGFYKDVSGKWRRLVGSKTVEDLPAGQEPAGTIYSLNWLPIGGFVRIKGQDGDGKLDSDSFASKSLWRRAVILAAGVVMNIVLAAIFLSVGYMMGMPGSLEEAKPSARITKAEVVIVETLPESPAERAGLQPGDIISAVNGEAIDSHERLQALVAANQGQDTLFLVKSGETVKEVTIVPETMATTGSVGVGVSIYGSGTVQYPFFIAIWEGIKMTGIMFWSIILAFYGLIKGLFMGMGAEGQVAGPVGIATLTGQVASLGFAYLLQFMALLSLNLALINILPFPALDGGRLLFLLIEKFIGRPVRQSVEAIVHTVGFWLLMLLIIFVTYKDIVRLF